MITQDSIITVADTLFPGVDLYTTDQMLNIFQSLSDFRTEVDKNPNRVWIYKRFVRFLFSKNMSNLDTMLLITAMKGGGKSSLGIQLAREWCNIIGKKFDPKLYIAYTNADLVKKIDTLPPFSPLLADESVRFITSEDWNKKENKSLKKKLAQIREKHLFFILCFPLKIKKVEKVYLESFVNYWIELYARGKAALFVRDSNPVFDSWRLDAFKEMGSYNEFTKDERIKKLIEGHPNFWKFFVFPRVPKIMYANYKKIREANVYRDDNNVFNTITKDDIYKSVLLLALNYIMTQDGAITMNRILLHIKNHYQISVPKAELNNIITDANNLITSVRENAMEGVD